MSYIKEIQYSLSTVKAEVSRTAAQHAGKEKYAEVYKELVKAVGFLNEAWACLQRIK